MATASNGQTEPHLSTFSSAKSCPIHFGPLIDAKSLPCGHVFCFECLKPYSSSNRVVCPLCNAVHRVDIYLLPCLRSPSSLGQCLIDALPASADEFLTKNKAETTENALKNVESACDMVIELLENMKDDFREMKSSFEQKRQSLADELKQINQQQNGTLTEEEKAIESKNFAIICDMFQRICVMAQDRALHKILQVSKDVEDVCQQVKSIGLCRYFVDSDQELTDKKEKEIIDCLANLVQSHANSPDLKLLCDNLVKAFHEKLSEEFDGVWTALVGDCSLIWDVPFTLSVQGQTSSLKMIVYCCHPSSTAKDGTHKMGMRVSQTKFKSIVESECKNQKSIDQDLMAKISKRVKEEFGGKWHCVTGKRDQVIAKSTGDRNFILKTEFEDMEFVCWKF